MDEVEVLIMCLVLLINGTCSNYKIIKMVQALLNTDSYFQYYDIMAIKQTNKVQPIMFFFTDQSSIRDVIFFPQLRPEG